MFLRNLNLFFPYLVLSTFLVADRIKGVLFLFFQNALNSFPVAVGAFLYNNTAVIIIALVLIVVWWRVGLSPTKPTQEREHRFNSGHKLVAIGNFLTFAYILLSYVTLQSTRGPATFLAALLLLVGLVVFVLWVIGIIKIWSSREMPSVAEPINPPDAAR